MLLLVELIVRDVNHDFAEIAFHCSADLAEMFQLDISHKLVVVLIYGCSANPCFLCKLCLVLRSSPSFLDNVILIIAHAPSVIIYHVSEERGSFCKIITVFGIFGSIRQFGSVIGIQHIHYNHSR